MTSSLELAKKALEKAEKDLADAAANGTKFQVAVARSKVNYYKNRISDYASRKKIK